MRKLIHVIKRCLNWLVQTRAGKSALWGLAIVFTLIVLLYQIANWGGARAWAEAAAMLEAEGETLDFGEMAPEPGPPSENFGALPVLDGISIVEDMDTEKGPGAEVRKRLGKLGLATNKEAKRPEGKGEGFGFGKGRDLDAWVKYLDEGGRFAPPENSLGAARDILEALEAADELVAELAAGVARPNALLVPRWEARVPENPFGMQLPHYESMRDAVRFFSLRATAAARAGDEERALESLLISLKFCELSASANLLISVLVARAGLEITLDALWEGLDAGVFSAESLARIQAELSEFDYREMMLAAMRTEMAAAAQVIHWAKDQEAGLLVGAIDGYGSASVGFERIPVSAIPVGWFDRNRAAIVNWNYRYYIDPLKTGSLVDVVNAKGEIQERVREAKEGFDPHSFLAILAFPAYEKVAEGLVYGQTALDLAVAACAVEAFRREQDAYPRNLESLVPEFLESVPLDRMDPGGATLRYLRYVEGGRCRIWSVGWDREDDGGARKFAESKAGQRKFSAPEYAGDWVWSYAP